MEHEEREEIPWSSLIPQAEATVDRRWYAVALVIGIVVLGFVGLRLVGRTSSPEPFTAAPPPPEVASSTTSEAPAELIVAEASLVAPAATESHRNALVRAEWFVADFYTRDGGADAVSSIGGAVVPGLVESALSLHETAGPESFVEWARVARFDEHADGTVRAVVAYRVIRATPDGYERLPVAFVVIEVETVDGVPLVSSLPVGVPAWSAAGP